MGRLRALASKIICFPLPASLSTADAAPPFAALYLLHRLNAADAAPSTSDNFILSPSGCAPPPLCLAPFSCAPPLSRAWKLRDLCTGEKWDTML
jgi:hypothetical protein